jgi:hypothetical protein
MVPSAASSTRCPVPGRMRITSATSPDSAAGLWRRSPGFVDRAPWRSVLYEVSELPRTHLLLSSSVTLTSARGRRGVPAAGSQKSYRVSSRSKRTSRAPSPTTAWKPSSGSFVKRDQHAIVVQPLPITLHTYPPPLHLVVGTWDGRTESLFCKVSPS